MAEKIQLSEVSPLSEDAAQGLAATYVQRLVAAEAAKCSEAEAELRASVFQGTPEQIMMAERMQADELERIERMGAHARAVEPSPATHAILAQLKAGETVYQAGELPKTFRVSNIHLSLRIT